MKPQPHYARPRLAWALLLIPAWLLVWSAHAIWRTYSAVPFNDQWVNFAAIRDAASGGWLHYLFSQHNEHRILFPRLVFLADLEWFQGRNAFNVVMIGLLQIMGAAAYVCIALSERLRVLGVLGLTAALAALFSLMQWENLFWGFQVSFMAVYAAAAWAIYLFCLAGRDPDRVRWGLMAGAMAMLVLATFSMANGVFAGFAMALMGVVARQRRAAVATAVIATAVLLAVYLYGYQRVEAHSPPSLALQHPGRFVFYVAIFFGNLWAPGNPTLAALIGLVGGLATAAMLFVLIRKQGADPGRAALFGVTIFVGVSAAVTSVGRLSFGVEQAMASRYITPTAYFWGAHALFWALTIERGATGWLTVERSAQNWTLTLRRGLGTWVRLGVGVVFVLMLWRLLALQELGELQVMGTRERILTGSSALLGGIRDDQAVRDVYPDPQVVADLTPAMRAKRQTIFADPPVATVGRPLERRIVPSAGVCHGFLDVLEPASGGDGVWRALGWGWDDKARRSFSRVVVTDSTGQVLGIGMSGLPRPDVPKVARDVRDPYAGWLVRLRPGAGDEAVAYGVTRDGTACELGRRRWSP